MRTLAQVKPQRRQPEIYDTDHDIFSPPLDALRYLLVNLPGQATDRRPPEPDPLFWQNHQGIW